MFFLFSLFFLYFFFGGGAKGDPDICLGGGGGGEAGGRYRNYLFPSHLLCIIKIQMGGAWCEWGACPQAPIVTPLNGTAMRDQSEDPVHHKRTLNLVAPRLIRVVILKNNAHIYLI